MLQERYDGEIDLGEAKLIDFYKDLMGDTFSLVKLCAEMEGCVQDSMYTHRQYVIIEGPLSQVKEKYGAIALLLQSEASGLTRETPDGPVPIKVAVEFYYISNKGEDGADRPMYDSERRPFYEGLCVPRMDEHLNLVDGGWIIIPPQGAKVRVGPGAADFWQHLIWSPWSPDQPNGPAGTTAIWQQQDSSSSAASDTRALSCTRSAKKVCRRSAGKISNTSHFTLQTI